MIEKRLDLEARFQAAELVIPCSHGWQGIHCDRDDEGSHPGSLDPRDDCYCGEAERIIGPDAIIERLRELSAHVAAWLIEANDEARS